MQDMLAQLEKLCRDAAECELIRNLATDATEDDYFDDVPSARVSKDMLDLAEHLLDTKAAKFNPDKFKDKYETALRALVKRKASGKTIEVPEAREEESNVIDLMDTLKQSLCHTRSSKAAKRAKRSKAHGRKRKAA
jgi:non-homologous end joining protein Ku